MIGIFLVSSSESSAYTCNALAHCSVIAPLIRVFLLELSLLCSLICDTWRLRETVLAVGNCGCDISAAQSRLSHPYPAEGGVEVDWLVA